MSAQWPGGRVMQGQSSFNTWSWDISPSWPRGSAGIWEAPSALSWAMESTPALPSRSRAAGGEYPGIAGLSPVPVPGLPGPQEHAGASQSPDGHLIPQLFLLSFWLLCCLLQLLSIPPGSHDAQSLGKLSPGRGFGHQASSSKVEGSQAPSGVSRAYSQPGSSHPLGRSCGPGPALPSGIAVLSRQPLSWGMS